MISVCIDVSKEKSTVCILKPYGEIISSPFEILHTESDLSGLVKMLQRFDEKVRMVMEATGAYHLPVLSHLKENDLYVSVINPFVMKEYRCKGLRRAKTDRLDAKMIAN
jgi:transposase